MESLYARGRVKIKIGRCIELALALKREQQSNFTFSLELCSLVNGERETEDRKLDSKGWRFGSNGNNDSSLVS